MFIKCLIYVAIVIVTVYVRFSIEHADKATWCALADACEHGGVAVCGRSSDGQLRAFIDVCDMHEYNCDSGQDYHATTMECMQPVTTFILTEPTEATGEAFIERPKLADSTFFPCDPKIKTQMKEKDCMEENRIV